MAAKRRFLATKDRSNTQIVWFTQNNLCKNNLLKSIEKNEENAALETIPRSRFDNHVMNPELWAHGQPDVSTGDKDCVQISRQLNWKAFTASCIGEIEMASDYCEVFIALRNLTDYQLNVQPEWASTTIGPY